MFKEEKDKGFSKVETIIGPSVKVEGDFFGQGDIIVQGVVLGNLKTKGHLEVGAEARITADVEAGSANIVLKMTNNRFVTPKSSSILSSVTRRSVMTLAGKELNLKCEERPVDLRAELGEIEEFAACGTAAVLSPVSQILFDGRWHTFISEGAPNGPTMQQLYKNLTQIQLGEVEDKYGWTYEV